MTYKKITFACKIVVHAFNGNAVVLEGFGEIRPADDKTDPLSEETVLSLIALGQILRKIHIRILASGYNITNGQLIKIEEKNGQ